MTKIALRCTALPHRSMPRVASLSRKRRSDPSFGKPFDIEDHVGGAGTLGMLCFCTPIRSFKFTVYRGNGTRLLLLLFYCYCYGVFALGSNLFVCPSHCVAGTGAPKRRNGRDARYSCRAVLETEPAWTKGLHATLSCSNGSCGMVRRARDAPVGLFPVVPASGAPPCSRSRHRREKNKSQKPVRYRTYLLLRPRSLRAPLGFPLSVPTAPRPSRSRHRQAPAPW